MRLRIELLAPTRNLLRFALIHRLLPGPCQYCSMIDLLSQRLLRHSLIDLLLNPVKTLH